VIYSRAQNTTSVTECERIQIQNQLLVEENRILWDKIDMLLLKVGTKETRKERNMKVVCYTSKGVASLRSLFILAPISNHLIYYPPTSK
jgi:hypothetical protein